MSDESKVKLVEITEPVISIQTDDATLFDHLLKIDAEKLEHYRKIQRDFIKMQDELQELINGD